MSNPVTKQGQRLGRRQHVEAVLLAALQHRSIAGRDQQAAAQADDVELVRVVAVPNVIEYHQRRLVGQEFAQSLACIDDVLEWVAVPEFAGKRCLQRQQLRGLAYGQPEDAVRIALLDHRLMAERRSQNRLTESAHPVQRVLPGLAPRARNADPSRLLPAQCAPQCAQCVRPGQVVLRQVRHPPHASTQDLSRLRHRSRLSLFSPHAPHCRPFSTPGHARASYSWLRYGAWYSAAEQSEGSLEAVKRLALVKALPDAVQGQVQQGIMPGHAATKDLLPLARTMSPLVFTMTSIRTRCASGCRCCCCQHLHSTILIPTRRHRINCDRPPIRLETATTRMFCAYSERYKCSLRFPTFGRCYLYDVQSPSIRPPQSASFAVCWHTLSDG